MTLIDGGVGCQAIKVFAAVSIPNPDSLTAGDYYVKGLIIMRPQFIFYLNETQCISFR